MRLADDPATGQVVLFGGADASGYLGDTWTWDGTSWTQRFPSSSPSPRANTAMTYDAARHQVLLFGGEAPGAGDDTWTWDGVNWTQQHPQDAPPFTEVPQMAYDAAARLVVLFPGDGSTWSWDGSNWTQEQPPSSPIGRGGGAMTRFGNDVLLFGGVNGDPESPVYYNDTWVWDGTTWTQLQPALSPPSPRAFIAAAYDQRHRRVVIFGGERALGAVIFGTTWTWNGTSWVRRVPDQTPPPRTQSGMAYDSTRGDVILFGGFGNPGFAADTWVWNGQTWSCVSACA